MIIIAVLTVLPCVALAGVLNHAAAWNSFDIDDDFAEPLPEVKSYVPWAKIIRVTHSDVEQPHKIYRVIQDDFLPSDKPSFYKIVELKHKANVKHLPQPGPLHVVSHTKTKW